jgi:hypothetical protein
MKKSIFLILIIFSLSLSACKPFPTINPTATPSSKEVATQVSQFLTSMPSSTNLPTAQSTNSPVSTSTQSPTSTTVIPSSTLEAAPTLALTATPKVVFSSTPAPTNTSAPVATATFSPGDPRLKLGTPTWQDAFKNDLNWPTGSDPFTSILIQNNTLALTALTKTDGWRLSYPTIENFYLEATLKSDNCAASDHFGLIVRVPDAKTANQGYLVGISCAGQFSLRKWDGTKMNALINWTGSSSINSGSGKSNRLGIQVVGSHFGIYVNGNLLAETIDNSFTKGLFGVFVGGQTPNLTMIVTAIAYWENP